MSLWNRNRTCIKKPAVASHQIKKNAALRKKKARGHTPVQVAPTEMNLKCRGNLYYCSKCLSKIEKGTVITIGISHAVSTFKSKRRRMIATAGSSLPGGFDCKPNSRSMPPTCQKLLVRPLIRSLPFLQKPNVELRSAIRRLVRTRWTVGMLT